MLKFWREFVDATPFLPVAIMIFCSCFMSNACSQTLSEASSLQYVFHENGAIELEGEGISSKKCILYLPKVDGEVHQSVFDLIGHFESGNDISFVKFAIAHDREGISENWSFVRRRRADDELSEKTGGCEILLFMDGYLFRCLAASSISDERFRLWLHLLAFDFNNEMEFVESNRPENYIDPHALLGSLELISDGKKTLLLYVENPYILCGETNLIKYFDALVSYGSPYRGRIIFGSGFSKDDLRLISDNLMLTVPMGLIPEKMEDEFIELRRANYSLPLNMLFTFDADGRYLESSYVWRDCYAVMGKAK